MDETLVTAAVDLSGRSFCVWRVELPQILLGTFSAELAEEFWRAVSANAGMNLHILLHHGSNVHHKIEAVFKATARALRQATELDPRAVGVPSTKVRSSAKSVRKTIRGESSQLSQRGEPRASAEWFTYTGESGDTRLMGRVRARRSQSKPRLG